jgi:hypothetical protein
MGNNINEYLVATLSNPDGSTANNNRITKVTSITGELTCLLGDSLVLTPNGYKKIETLRNNDLIISGDSLNKPKDEQRIIKIKNVSKTTTTKTDSLCKIPKGLYNNTEDIYLTSYHAIFDTIKKQFIRPIDLPKEELNKLLVKTDKERLTYYNLELYDKVKDTFVVSGMIVEGNRQFYKTGYSFEDRNKMDEFLELF